MTHTEEKPYQCNHCDKAFIKNSDLMRYVMTPTKQKSYQCNHCKNAYSNNFDLKKHMRTHTGEKPLQCCNCDKTFSNSSDLLRHVSTHTGEKQDQCSNNDKASSDILTTHIYSSPEKVITQIHLHSDSVTEYSCLWVYSFVYNKVIMSPCTSSFIILEKYSCPNHDFELAIFSFLLRIALSNPILLFNI